MDSEAGFRFLFYILLFGVMAMRIYFSRQVARSGERLLPDQAAVNREGRLSFAARMILFFGLFALLVLYVLNVPWTAALSLPFPGWLRWLGFFLGLLSLALWIWAQAALGIQWSPQLQLREEHHLVTSGPYAYIRHPIYTAMFGYGIGLALVTANWVFIVLAALIFPFLFARVPREEQMMVNRFGDAYREYARRTGRYVPGIGREMDDRS